MKAEQCDTLDGYVRHAEHYGTSEVFETAIDEGLRMRDLGRLALRLQNLNPQWKLTTEVQRLFVLSLVERGVSDRDCARMAGCSIVSVRTWVADDQDLGDVDPELALRAASKARFSDLKGIVRGWHRSS